jgi:hypothetical protein
MAEKYRQQQLAQQEALLNGGVPDAGVEETYEVVAATEDVEEVTEIAAEEEAVLQEA